MWKYFFVLGMIIQGFTIQSVQVGWSMATELCFPNVRVWSLERFCRHFTGEKLAHKAELFTTVVFDLLCLRFESSFRWFACETNPTDRIPIQKVTKFALTVLLLLAPLEIHTRIARNTLSNREKRRSKNCLNCKEIWGIEASYIRVVIWYQMYI